LKINKLNPSELSQVLHSTYIMSLYHKGNASLNFTFPIRWFIHKLLNQLTTTRRSQNQWGIWFKNPHRTGRLIRASSYGQAHTGKIFSSALIQNQISS